jgi:hypothetical protein
MQETPASGVRSHSVPQSAKIPFDREEEKVAVAAGIAVRARGQIQIRFHGILS